MPCRRRCGLRLFLVGLVGRWMIFYGLLISRDYFITTYFGMVEKTDGCFDFV